MQPTCMYGLAMQMRVNQNSTTRCTSGGSDTPDQHTMRSGTLETRFNGQVPQVHSADKQWRWTMNSRLH